VSRPRSSVRGRRPTATRISSASTRSPSLRSTFTFAPTRRTPRASTATRTVTPRSTSDSSTCSPANGSSRASRRSPASISVTPRAERAVGLSHLDPYRSAAEHDQAGDSVRRGDLVAGPWLGLDQPGDRGHGSSATDRDRHCLASFAQQLTDADAALALEATRGPGPRISVTPRSSNSLSARLVRYFSPHPSACWAALSESVSSSLRSSRRRRLFSNQGR
jgi:hypothetical protein